MYSKLTQLHESGRSLRHACGETTKTAIVGRLAGKLGLKALGAAGWAVQHPLKALTLGAGAHLAGSSVQKGVRAGRATRVSQAVRPPTYAA